MEGSKHRLSATRTVVAGVVLAGVVAIAGCGGGGGSNKPAVPPPTAGAGGAGGVVSAEGTKGLVGPAERANSKTTSATDKTGKIAGNANRPVRVRGKNGVAGEADCPNAGATPTADNLADVNAAILCLVNAERHDNGNLPPLSSNPQLQQAAEGMAARMVKEQFFSHETPDGKNVVDRVEPTGYIPNSGDWVVGENLGWGSGALSTPQAMVNGWMNSPGHRANILAPDYKDVGLAAALGSPSPSQSGGTTYVNDFGAKSGADTSATLPPESGASTSDTSGGGNNSQASSASANNSQATAGTKSKSKKKAKKRRRRKRH